MGFALGTMPYRNSIIESAEKSGPQGEYRQPAIRILAIFSLFYRFGRVLLGGEPTVVGTSGKTARSGHPPVAKKPGIRLSFYKIDAQ